MQSIKLILKPRPRIRIYHFFGLILFICLGFLACSPEHQIKAEELHYNVDGQKFVGYIAYPETEADAATEHKNPGILVVHEWWGHNDYARMRARKLAQAGYTALALDMYGDGKTAGHPSEAGAFSKAVFANMDAAEKRFVAALNKLKNHPTVNPDQIAAIGYCFGGGIALTMARREVDLDAVASFHGTLASPQAAQPGKLKARILVLTGAADKFVPTKQVEAFRDEMQAANADFEIVSYPEAKHSFTNPKADELAQKFNIPIGYNKQADQNSWQKLMQFLKETWPDHK